MLQCVTVYSFALLRSNLLCKDITLGLTSNVPMDTMGYIQVLVIKVNGYKHSCAILGEIQDFLSLE